MNKRKKILIAVGSALAVGTIGYFTYRAITKRNNVAKDYLREVDENGGNVPSGRTVTKPNLVKMVSTTKSAGNL